MSTKEHRSAEVLEDVQLRHITFKLEDVQVRTSGGKEGGVNFDGHAAVFNTPTTLFETEDWRIDERIDAGAFTEILSTNPDVHLNINHDMQKVMARTGVDGLGGMELTQDDTGLHVYARLDPDISYISDLVKLIERGVVDQMSFAFLPGEYTMTTHRDKDGYETDLFTHHSFSAIRDVCVCARGAYPTTDASVRNLIQERTEVRALNRVATPEEEEGTNELVAEVIPGVAQTETIADTDPGSDSDNQRVAAEKLRVKKILATNPLYRRND